MGATRTPWVTLLLAGANLWVAYAITGFAPTEESLAPVAWGSDDLAAENWEPLFTSMFAHAGLLHLGFNVIALLAFGSLLERTLGHLRYAAVYLASGILANLAHAALFPGAEVVGASGAIFGVLGALVLLRPLVWTMLLFLVPLPILFASALYVALVPILSAADPYVAHLAHLAGMGVGMLAALLIAPRRSLRVLLAWVIVAAATWYGVAYAVGLWVEREGLRELAPLDLALVILPLALALGLIVFTHRHLSRAGYGER